MNPIILILLILIPTISQLVDDPAPGLLVSKADSKKLECFRTTTEGANRLVPGQVRNSAPRGDFIRRSAVICTEQIMNPGDRNKHDEAILYNLEFTVREFIKFVDTLDPNIKNRIWHVETFYPNPAISTKITFAGKNALVNKGLKVSDRIPTLAAGDITVLASMRPMDAYPLACNRYFDKGSLTEDHALLGIVLLDKRETILHAGVCSSGKWRWLQ